MSFVVAAASLPKSSPTLFESESAWTLQKQRLIRFNFSTQLENSEVELVHKARERDKSASFVGGGSWLWGRKKK